MKVLILHSRYLSGASSGENRVVGDEARLLREAGHEVVLMDPEPNVHSRRDVVKTGIETLWARSAAARVRTILSSEAIDIVHCHNLFPALSPAVLRASKSAGVPTVMTLHNYRLMCLPATLLRDDNDCELCVGRVPWRGVKYRCYRGSGLASAALATSLTLHRTLGTFKDVTRFLSVSEFVKDKYVQAGFDPAQIEVKANFTWASDARTGPGEYFLYIGRLSVEKGVEILLEGWRPSLGNLLVVGSGPEAGRLHAMKQPSVEFRDAVEADQVPDIVRNARAVVVPSVCHEGAPRVVLESFAAGVPVVGTRMGALPELIDHGVTGYIVEPRAAEAWADPLERLSSDDTSTALGRAAHAEWSARYSPQRGLEGLERSYASAMS